jgi:hypothetical protein
MKISEIVENQSNGFFCAFKIDTASANALYSYTAELGLRPIDADSLHITLLRLPKMNVDLANLKGFPVYIGPRILKVVMRHPFMFFSIPERNIFSAPFIQLSYPIQLYNYRATVIHWLQKAQGFKTLKSNNKISNRWKDWLPHITLSFGNADRTRAPDGILPNARNVKLKTILKSHPDKLPLPISQVEITEPILSRVEGNWEKQFM